MNLAINNNINFRSRNKTIRDMEKICRIINSEFPSVSSTRINCFQHAKDFETYTKKLAYYFYKNVRTYYDEWLKSGDNYFWNTFLESIKKYKIANCTELSNIATLICKINNIKVTHGELYQPGGSGWGRHIDHTFCIINSSGEQQYSETFTKKNANWIRLPKGSLIIDPWFNFVDYADNAIFKYNSIYAKDLKINPKKNLTMKDAPELFKFERISKETLQSLSEKYPQFILHTEVEERFKDKIIL